MLSLIPRYLPRFGMAPHWVGSPRPLILVLLVIDLIVTVVFDADVDNFPPENLDEFADFGQTPRSRRNLDQHQVAFDQILIQIVHDFDDGDDLFELLTDLIENLVVTGNNECNPRELWPLGFPDGEAFDIERARREHPRDVREHPRLVHHDRGQNMLHRTGTFLGHGRLQKSSTAHRIIITVKHRWENIRR